MRFPWPLRYTVPGVILLLGCVMGVVSFLHGRALAHARVEGIIERHARFMGRHASTLATHLLAQRDADGLGKQVASIAADPILRIAVICDHELNVIASSQPGLEGRVLNGTPFAHVRDKLSNADQIIIGADRNTMLGIFPLNRPADPAAGFLLLEYDMTKPKSNMSMALIDGSAIETAVLALFCIAAWFFFHRVLNGRMGHLVAATRKFAAGESTRIEPLSGSDEVAELSEAIAAMAGTISESTAGLRAANERMKQEINERTFIEEALRNSERRFRSIWENSLEAMRLTDERGVVLAVNPAYCRLMEQPAHDLIELPFTVAYQPDAAERQLIKYQEGFRARSIESYRARRITLASGRTIDIEASFSFIEMERDRPLLLGILRDVSDQMAVLERLREAKEFSENLIKTANVLIVGLDKEGRINIFNETAEQVAGFRKAEAIGRRWRELMVCSNDGRDEAVADGMRRNFEARLMTRGREERLIAWQTNPLLERGVCAGTICFGIDITDKKRQEDQRLALERKLLDSQKLESLGVLAGGIAHDFNNLLAAILGNANLASMQLPPASSAGAYVRNIEKTSMRAADLCRQMLAYSGKGRFSLAHLDLNEVVQETLELLEVSIAKKAALRVELRPGIPTVHADGTQLRQVVMNLVINASEAIGDNSGLIRIRTGTLHAEAAYFENAYVASRLEPGEYVFVEVSDTGCGMTPETQARIFDPFFSTKFTGRGLGLAAVLGIVRGHNGALKIMSAPGQGSTFKFVLPASTLVPQRRASRSAPDDADWKGEGTILVVDDDPTVRAVIARMVEASGFDVLQAVDGRHGVEVFTANRKKIRAVILDMMMPNLNGREAFEEMSRIDPAVKVLIVSGYSQDSTTSDFAHGSIGGFLQKPFKSDELNRKLRALLDEPKRVQAELVVNQ